MKLLLDTHVIIWFDGEPERIPPATLAAICDPSNDVLVSAASFWEIRIKTGIGKLKLDSPLEEMAQDAILRGFAVIPVTTEHVFQVASLPDVHKDPFDRMLAAQSIFEKCKLVTSDAIFKHYPVDLFW